MSNITNLAMRGLESVPNGKPVVHHAKAGDDDLCDSTKSLNHKKYGETWLDYDR
jgi:hypothetical protein